MYFENPENEKYFDLLAIFLYNLFYTPAVTPFLVPFFNYLFGGWLNLICFQYDTWEERYNKIPQVKNFPKPKEKDRKVR